MRPPVLRETREGSSSMRLWKQVQTRVEPHVNRALLFSILACLVVLLTYLLGGAGAFFAFHWGVQANAASAPGAASPTTTTTTAAGVSGGITVVSVISAAGGVVLTLQVSPLDISYNCALGANAAQQLTITNPDSVAHPFTLSWNSPNGAPQGFVASLLPPGTGAAGTLPAHGSQQIQISGSTQLGLNAMNPTSQYLWVSESIAGTSTTVAKVHVWCSTFPAAVPTVPTITLTPPPIP